ncbi:related to Cytochrome c oxidase subunit 6B-like protein new16 [Cephalotrichum gorgonifer]|uniref:Related to Cytochrome c oxidase subunit 6B-like protein new16 n=1 Tax=Cephalotrichum gorgonifer TaxID=2041049 RepID=A0AAE8T027_9PEZI|nr:related to Cytochrome c oxidase subunit 6B-like protein new16 [Cephalotrichum gorgonifer]
MGLFSSAPPDRATQIRTGAIAPSRTERRQCWAARDAYFGCLDANAIADPKADEAGARKTCPAETEAFERDCAAKWVSYFKDWRVVEAKKRAKIEALEREGAVRMDVTTEFKPK